MRTWPLLLVPIVALATAAQESPHAKSTTGTVTGHVYCADTNTPARAAHIQLEAVKAAEERSTGHPQPYAGLPDGGVVQTTLDGNFAITNIPPGSYYVVAAAPGYLSPRAHDEDIDDAEPQPPAGQPPITIPKVEVQADQVANVDIRLERGASVTGTIRFDDGSPATGIRVELLHRSGDKWVKSRPLGFTTAVGRMGFTDDLGQYRISGVRDREYLLAATLIHFDMSGRANHPTTMATRYSSLTIYSGDTARKHAAVPFKLSAGEERDGEDVTIPLSKLHSVSGIVTAARDGHAINYGAIAILDPGETEPLAESEIGSDGSFRLDSVPEGACVLRVNTPQDKITEEVSLPQAISGDRTMPVDKPVHTYANTEQTLQVKADITSLVIAVPELKSDAAKPAAQ